MAVLPRQVRGFEWGGDIRLPRWRDLCPAPDRLVGSAAAVAEEVVGCPRTVIQDHGKPGD